MDEGGLVDADYVIRERCRVCNGANIFGYRATPQLVTCAECALTYAREPQTTVTYDRQYVADRYDRYTTTDQMSYLRLRVIEYVLYLQETLPGHRFGVRKGPLLDVGYGNGSFIRRCLAEKWDAYGCDVNPAEYEGVRKVYESAVLDGPRWRAVTFFDSLEHFESLDWIRQVVDNSDWLIISAPLPPPTFPRDLTWKHYRPGEHHWYFGEPWTYERIFRTETHRARVAYVGYPEDSVRGNLADGSHNIMTCVLRTELMPEEKVR